MVRPISIPAFRGEPVHVAAFVEAQLKLTPCVVPSTRNGAATCARVLKEAAANDALGDLRKLKFLRLTCDL